MERAKTMQKDEISSLNIIVDDLESLIAEIENNPRISSWVLRMTLKCIRDKAAIMATDTAQQQAHFEDLALLK